MKKSIFLLVLVLVGCSGVNTEEHRLVGRWLWSFDDGDHIESGSLQLNSDRTFTFKINSQIPFENLSEVYDGSFGFWKYEQGTIFFHPKNNASEERAVFTELQFKDNQISFKLVGFFSNKRLYATREKR